MTWIAAAIIGVASIASAGIGASASAKAGKQGQQGAARAAALAQQGKREATAQLSPWSAAGGLAAKKYNALLGLGGGPATEAGFSGGVADFGDYVRRSPDLMAEWSKPKVQAQFGGDIASYGQWHQENYGDHGAVPTEGGAWQPGSAEMTPEQAQSAGMDEFHASPFYTTTRAAGEAGTRAILGSAGARAGTVSGKAMRSVQDFTNENEQAVLDKYLTSLNGVASTGFSADTGIANADMAATGQTIGASNSATQAQIAATQGGAKSTQEGLSDLAALYGYYNGKKNPAPATTPASTGYSPLNIPQGTFTNGSGLAARFNSPMF